MFQYYYKCIILFWGGHEHNFELVNSQRSNAGSEVIIWARDIYILSCQWHDEPSHYMCKQMKREILASGSIELDVLSP